MEMKIVHGMSESNRLASRLLQGKLVDQKVDRLGSVVLDQFRDFEASHCHLTMIEH